MSVERTGKRAHAVAFLRARLSPEGALGLHLTIGALVLIAAAWIFGDLAEDVVTGDHITVVDLALANRLHAAATTGMTRAMLFVSLIHDLVAMSLATVVLGAYFVRRRHLYWLLALALAVPGGMLLNVALKLAIHRVRPTFDDPIVTLTTYSFPSGHVSGSTLFYGMLASFLVVHARSNAARAAIALAAIAMVVLVAVSRMYLGAHYLSDVLGAFVASVAWLALCITGVNVFSRRRGDGLGRGR